MTALAAWVLAPSSRVAAQAVQASDLRLRAISVDTEPLGRKGLSGAMTAAIRDQLVPALAGVFADRMVSDRAAPMLVVRIDSFSLASYAGNDDGPFNGQQATDYLEGAGIVMSGGHVVSTTPILSALAASYSGAWYLPDIDARRVASISHHFAYWLRREMGL